MLIAETTGSNRGANMFVYTTGTITSDSMLTAANFGMCQSQRAKVRWMRWYFRTDLIVPFILPLRCNVAMLVNSIRQDMEKEIIFIGIFGEQGTEKVTYVYTNHRSSGRKPTSTAGPIVH